MMGDINIPMSHVSRRLASFSLMLSNQVRLDTDADGVDCQKNKNKPRFGSKVFVGSQTSFIKLARAGFYFAGRKSGICCFSCHVQYNCWEGESPIGVHRILNPHCKYLNSEDETGASSTGYLGLNRMSRTVITTDAQGSHHSCSRNHHPCTDVANENISRSDETPTRPMNSNSIQDNNNSQLQNVRRNIFPLDDNTTLSIRNPGNRTSETQWMELKHHSDEFTGRIVHPKVGNKQLMCRESFRILTFPDPTEAKAEEWAAAGFTYEVGRVRCVYCGGCSSFDETSVKTVHQRISPKGRYCCPLVSGIDVGDVSRDLEKLVREKLKNGNKNTNELRNIRNLYSAFHPQYKLMEERLASFKFWPKHYKPTKTQLAEAGFFHSGVAIKVVCFCCGVSIIDWNCSTADPWQQHALLSPTCGFIKQERGEEFIKQAAHIQKLVDEDPLVREPVTVMCDLVIPDPYPATLDATQLAAYSSCGYPPNQIFRLIQQIFKQTRGRYPSVPMLRAAILADGELKKHVDLLDLQDEVIEKKDNQLNRLDHVMTVKDQHYKTTVASINQEHCQQMNHKEQQLHQQSNQLHEKDDQLHEKDDQIHEKDDQLHEKDDQLHEKDDQLQGLCNRLQLAVTRHEVREDNLLLNNLTLQQEIERYQAEIERQKHEIEAEIEKYQAELSNLATEYTRLKAAGREGDPVDPESQNRICLFCLTEEKIIMFQPCRHVCSCINCASHFIHSKCPLCRVPVQDWQVVFLS